MKLEKMMILLLHCKRGKKERFFFSGFWAFDVDWGFFFVTVEYI